MKQPNLFWDDDQQQDAPKPEHKTKPQAAGKYVSSVWSFPHFNNNQLYRWYGTLPQPLVERLMTLYGLDDRTHVLDAFMGSGTTLDVAADRSLGAVGLDVNPVACLLSEARLFGVPDAASVLAEADQIVEDLTLGSSRFPAPQHGDQSAFVTADRYEYTRKWFRPDTLEAVLSLLFRIAETQDVRIQRLMFVVAAQVIRQVASVDPRCTHHLVTKQKPFIDPVPLWRKSLMEGLPAMRSVPADPSLTSVVQGSVLTAPIPENSVNFALVHPPYLGVINYHLIHRLASDLLDFVNSKRSPAALEPYNFDHQQLKKHDVSTDHSGKYQQFVEALASKMYGTVSPNGRCAIIIGDQRHKGHLRHPFTDFIRWFEKCGFMLEENFIWLLQNNGGMHVLRRGHFIDHNYILIFHK